MRCVAGGIVGRGVRIVRRIRGGGGQRSEGRGFWVGVREGCSRRMVR